MRERRAHQRSIQITVPTSVVVGAMIGQTIAVFWQEDLAAATQFTPAASTGIAIASHLKTLPRQTVALQDQYPNRSSFGLRGLVWEVLFQPIDRSLDLSAGSFVQLRRASDVCRGDGLLGRDLIDE